MYHKKDGAIMVKNSSYDFVGYKKGNIEVVGIGYIDEKSGKRMFEVKCNLCGNIFYKTRMSTIKSIGKGCKKCSTIYLRVANPVKAEKLHGIWQAMRKRCSCKDENDKHYKYYSGRGIKVCDEWQNSYLSFREWALNNGWEENKGLSIDRIDSDGDYCPENCRFATATEQQYNRRNTFYVDYNGKKYTCAQLSELCGLPQDIIQARIKYGWDIETALHTPLYGIRSYKKEVKDNV